MATTHKYRADVYRRVKSRDGQISFELHGSATAPRIMDLERHRIEDGCEGYIKEYVRIADGYKRRTDFNVPPREYEIFRARRAGIRMFDGPAHSPHDLCLISFGNSTAWSTMVLWRAPQPMTYDEWMAFQAEAERRWSQIEAMSSSERRALTPEEQAAYADGAGIYLRYHAKQLGFVELPFHRLRLT